MAKAKAKCICATCGIEFTVTATKRNSAECTSWEEWATSHYDECDACREKRIKSEHAEENKKAAEYASSNNLPNLFGTDKQIVWAETLRANVFTELNAQMEKTKSMDAQRHTVVSENLTCAHAVLLAKTKASWWIDNAQNGFQELTRDRTFLEEVSKMLKDRGCERQ